MNKTFYLFTSLLLAATGAIYSQVPTDFLQIRGSDETSITFNILDTDTLPDGNFLGLVGHSENDQTGRDFSLFKIDPFTGAILDQGTAGGPGNQYAKFTSVLPSGDIWVWTTTHNITPTNFNDLKLYHLNAELDFEDAYSFDIGAFELITDVVTSGANLISAVVGDKAVESDPYDFRILTINTNTGTIISEYPLAIGCDLNRGELVSNGNGQVIWLEANETCYQLLAIDVLTGTEVFTEADLDFSFSDCQPTGELWEKTLAYYPTKQQYILLSACLDVFFIDQDGNLTISSISGAEDITSISRFTRIKCYDDGFYLIGGIKYYRIDDSGDEFSLDAILDDAQQFFFGESPLLNGRVMAQEFASNFNFVIDHLDDEAEVYLTTPNLPFGNWARWVSNAKLDLINDEIVIAELHTFKTEGDWLLFYSLDLFGHERRIER